MKAKARILFILFVFSILLLPIQQIYAETTEEIDYHQLFTSYHSLDGIYASDYFIKVNKIYNADPDRFITELAKENYETIVFQAQHLTIEQYFTNENYADYHNAISDRLQKLDSYSKYTETLTLMLYGSTLYQAAEKPSIEADHREVQSAFNENPKLFLLSLSVYRHSGYLSKLTSALIINTFNTQWAEMEDQLNDAVKADWATEDVRAVIAEVQKKLLTEKIIFGYEATDLETLFSILEQVDGYRAESYFIQVSKAFDKATEDFVTALSVQPIEKILSIGNSLYWNHKPNTDSYNKQLNDMIGNASADSAIYETLFLIRMTALRYESSSHIDFVTQYHQQVQSYYQENSRLFALALTEQSAAQFADALVFEQDTDKLKQLDTQLTADSDADWATEDTKAVITAIRQRIDEILNPPPTVPEPTVTEPPETSAPPATDPAPTDQPAELPSVTDNKLVITMIVALAAIIAAAFAWALVLKKKA